MPDKDAKVLAAEYFYMTSKERCEWQTLEDWLLAKGYQKSLINKQVEESDELRALYE